MRIAIDTGGTFTDCVYRKDGELRVLKVRSTPEDPGRSMLEAVLAAEQDVGQTEAVRAEGRNAGLLTGIAKLRTEPFGVGTSGKTAGVGRSRGDAGLGKGPGSRERVRKNAGAALEVRHGTTVGTNALLERKGGRVAFVTTEGFEDTIFIGRQARPQLYAWTVRRASPLVEAGMCFGVRERVASDGTILKTADAAELERLRAAVMAAHPESVAVSLLFAFANPANERAVVEALEGLGVPVSASHRILPEFREYERGSTVTINAYLAPVMEGYLRRLQAQLAGRGASLQIMQSSGGIVSAEVAAREPVRTILSGPAGGVMGALEVARRAGLERILTFDMGGTSTDVALLEVAKPLETTSEAEIAGLPVAVPMLDIHTVGAGGGSLARFDAGGMLVVGPESAGAVPGPACYGRGEQPTVTDANLLLGRIDAEHFLGGGMRLEVERTRALFERAKGRVATVEAFAEGIVRLAEARMESALRKISIERGHDPGEFALLSFGGAGPLHACGLARALGIPEVVVPEAPGALSALGILECDVVREFSRTVMLAPVDARIEKEFREVERAGLGEMRAEGLAAVVERRLDMRYAGQGYELTVACGRDARAAREAVGEFHRLHARRYGYADEARAVEVVNVRVRLIAASAAGSGTTAGSGSGAGKKALRRGDARQAVLKRTRVYAEGRWHAATLYARERLRPGDRLRSPAVVVEYSATTYLPAGSAARVDGLGNLRVELPSRR